jgi:hypothetical protein
MPEPHDMTDEEPIPDTLRMFPATAEARAELDGALDALGSDEVRVLARIAERLKRGARTYGVESRTRKRDRAGKRAARAARKFTDRVIMSEIR